jgi:BirA family transcriptional regulator, biotin operon repressor / biotin---[acetyl-CoA-carboxylase] ligase
VTAGEPLPPDIADAIKRARPRLAPLAAPLLFFSTIGSTNDEAASIATEGTVIVADAQTAGRGRRGRTWFSPPGSGLYISTVLTPARARVDPRRATTLLTLAAGVAIAEGILASTGLDVDLKWPNDLYTSGRKLAGILAEAVRDVVVLGYGINLTASAFPPDLRDRVTSLEGQTGLVPDRARVLVETLAALAVRYGDLLAGRFDAILDAWRLRAPAAVGARVRWTAGSIAQSGVTAGVGDDGALLVRTERGIERIVGGEVQWT